MFSETLDKMSYFVLKIVLRMAHLSQANSQPTFYNILCDGGCQTEKRNAISIRQDVVEQ